ncbi:hypothetical protein D3C87_2108830 [compost metagenome]
MRGRRPSNGVESTHLWRGSIPARTLSAGLHKIEVRATDMFGNVFTEEQSFKVEEPVK